MKFWKMHGAGNDFILINNIEEKIPHENFSYLAKHLCQHHFSIGADGIMFIDKADAQGDVKMEFYNSDGSVSEMCGNGVRCLARYCYENGLAGSEQSIETISGVVFAERVDKRNYKIRLNEPSKIKLNQEALIDGHTIPYSYIELGDPGLPHVAVPISNLKEKSKETLFNLGKKFRYYSDFPKGANVNFFDIIGEDRVLELTWERGVEDFTYACGTGTGSVVTILTLLGKVSGKHVEVDMEGGKLYIDIKMGGEKVEAIYLTGSTNVVAVGEIIDEDIRII